MQVKISVLGHFGEGANLLNGQTVKTKIVTEELQNQLGNDQVMKIDTHGGWKTLLKAPLQVFSALKNSKNVLIFPAQNGLKVYAPLLSLMRPLFRKRQIHYVVIGGWLPKFITTRNSLAKALRKFDGIYVETNTMKKVLEDQGFTNVFVMPNCKKLRILTEQELVYPSGLPYKLCTFSRVMKEKGIEDAIKAVIQVNTELGYQVFSLDIYGQVDAAQVEWFDKLQKNFPEYIRYGGLVPFDKSVDVLKEYFALLFPTYYEGEGFAGTLIDAYSAGVPVIASDWKYNSELVCPNITGLLVKSNSSDDLVSALIYIQNNVEQWNRMKVNCLNVSRSFIPENAIQVLRGRIN